MGSLDLLVPSLTLGNDSESCNVVNGLSIEWLLNRPHTIMWADKIFISKSGYELYTSPNYDDVLHSSCRDTLIELKKKGIIELIDHRHLLSKSDREIIALQAAQDEKVYQKKCADEGEIVYDMGIKINDIEICRPKLREIYAALAISKELNAGILFNTVEERVVNTKFSKATSRGNIPSMNGAFSALFPAFKVMTDGAYASKCQKCESKSKCRTKFQEESSTRLGTVLDLRTKYEMVELKQVINRAIYTVRKQTHDVDDVQSIVDEFNRELYECKERINGLFPKCDHWFKISVLISSSIAFMGEQIGDGIVTTAGLGLGLASGLGLGVTDSLRDKYRWVSFVDELKNAQTSQ